MKRDEKCTQWRILSFSPPLSSSLKLYGNIAHLSKQYVFVFFVEKYYQFIQILNIFFTSFLLSFLTQ